MKPSDTAKSGGGRPKMYKLADGTRVPGVTTIIGRFKESGALMYWAWSQGREGLDYRQTADKAATAGSICHDMIEAWILGRPAPASSGDVSEAVHEMAARGFEAFLTWAKMTALQVTETEVPLVSERYRFGGTLDAIGTVGGELSIVDWKTSNRIYADYLLQLAAYRALWEERQERLGEVSPIAGAHLLQVGKEFADFHHHYWPARVLDEAWRAFELQRRLYDFDKVLKAATGA